MTLAEHDALLKKEGRYEAMAVSALASFAKLGRVGRVASTLCCFVAGTLVDTEYGLRPIEDIKVGDRVWARSEETGEVALKPVTNLIQHREREIWVLVFEVENADGSKSVQEFETTDDHPWADANGGWTKTQDLHPGMFVLRAAGKPARVASLVNTQRTQPTYNLDVAEFHNYFAGRARVWVHNCGVADVARGATSIGAKIEKQIAKRGWSRQSVDDAITNPTRTVATKTRATCRVEVK